jgi:hypothetical protein
MLSFRFLFDLPNIFCFRTVNSVFTKCLPEKVGGEGRGPTSIKGYFSCWCVIVVVIRNRTSVIHKIDIIWVGKTCWVAVSVYNVLFYSILGSIYQLYHGVDNTMTHKQNKCHAVRAVQKCHAVRAVQKCHAVREVQKCHAVREIQKCHAVRADFTMIVNKQKIMWFFNYCRCQLGIYNHISLSGVIVINS